MDKVKRPKSVTVIAWLAIVRSILFLPYMVICTVILARILMVRSRFGIPVTGFIVPTVWETYIQTTDFSTRKHP